MRTATRFTPIVSSFAVLTALLVPIQPIAIDTDAAEALRQESTATLKGRVNDAAGRGLAGVEVSAQSPVLFGPVTTQTSETGEYRFAALPPGPYVVAFSRSGLVPVKMTVRLSLAEPAIISIVMRPHDGDAGAITVSREKQVFPPSWTTSFTSRHSDLEELPVTGTVRTSLGLVTDLPGLRPDWTLVMFDGLPLRQGWNVSQNSFAGPGSEALAELAAIPGRLGPEYGRLQTGAIQAVTRSGANILSGSVKGVFDGADLNADILRDARAAKGMAGSAEYTLGGPVIRDRGWFFASGRNLRQTVDDRTALTDLPFDTSTRERLGLAKVTFAPRPGHRLEGEWMGVSQKATNTVPQGVPVVSDTNALATSVMADRAVSVAYVGRVQSRFDLALRYTHERATTEWTGASQSGRTAFVDQQTGAALLAAPVCAGCDPRIVTHGTLRLTANTAVKGPMGIHDVTVGYDLARSSLTPEIDPAGDRFDILSTRSFSAGGVVFPVTSPGSTWIVWRPVLDRRVSASNHAFFVGDRWMPTGRLAFDLGVRVDRNAATRTVDGLELLSETVVGPRVFASWLLSDEQPWTFTAGFARYAADVAERLFDEAPAFGTRAFAYQSASLNAAGPQFGPAETRDRVLGWFASAGGVTRQPIAALEPDTAGLSLAPLRTDEWSVGVSRPIGFQGHARLDLARRTYSQFASPLLERSYNSITLKAKYRFGHYADVDAQYTLSSLSGNTADSSPAWPGNGTDLAYPEYFDTSWRLPTGNLPDDARHRLRMWAHSEIIAHDSIGLVLVTLVHSRESGRPYGAAGLIGVSPYVTNPGHATPPTATTYYFTERDAFRTEPHSRWDIGVSYRRRLPGTVRGDLFAAFHVLNISNRPVVLHPERWVKVSTAFTDPALLPFNPFTESPLLGTHWTMDDANVRRGTARNPIATTLPRAYRFTMGIRF